MWGSIEHGAKRAEVCWGENNLSLRVGGEGDSL